MSKRSLYLSLATVLACTVHAVPASAINLVQAYNAALKNDPTFRMAVYEAEGGREYRVMGRSALLPTVQANYSANKTKADVLQPNILGNLIESHPQYMSRSASVQLRQPLFNMEALARYKQGVAQSAQFEANFSSRVHELALRVVAGYSDALLAQETVALATAQRDMYLEQKRVNDRLFEKGEGTKTDMLETQARLDLSEAQLLEAQDGERTAFQSLSGIIGQEVTTLDGLGEEFRVLPLLPSSFDGWKDIAVKNNPSLIAQQHAIEVAKQEVNKARSGHAPRLDLVASYSQGKSESLTTLNQDSTQRTLGIQLNVPLYSGGYVNAVSRQAVANRERAKADLEAKSDAVIVDVRKSHGTVVSSMSRIAALEKAVNSSKLLIKATEQSIKGGVRINLDLLNAQQALFTAQRDLAQARLSYIVALLRLKASAGTLTFDDVQQVATYFK